MLTENARINLWGDGKRYSQMCRMVVAFRTVKYSPVISEKKAKLCLAAATIRGLIVQLITSQKIQVGICDRNIYW